MSSKNTDIIFFKWKCFIIYDFKFVQYLSAGSGVVCTQITDTEDYIKHTYIISLTWLLLDEVN